MSILESAIEKVLSLSSAREAKILGGSKGSGRIWLVVGLVVVLVFIFWPTIAAALKAGEAKETGAAASGYSGFPTL